MKYKFESLSVPHFHSWTKNTIHDDFIKNIPVTGPLCGESTGLRWIPLTKGSDAATEQRVEVIINKILVSIFHKMFHEF